MHNAQALPEHVAAEVANDTDAPVWVGPLPLPPDDVGEPNQFQIDDIQLTRWLSVMDPHRKKLWYLQTLDREFQIKSPTVPHTQTVVGTLAMKFTAVIMSASVKDHMLDYLTKCSNDCLNIDVVLAMFQLLMLPVAASHSQCPY